MTTRRAFIGTLAGGNPAAPLAVEAQKPGKPRIGWLTSSVVHTRNVDAFRQGMAALGYRRQVLLNLTIRLRALYAVFALIVLMMLLLVQRAGERTDTPRVRFEDPYLIAYLRGGENEALRVATVSLIDRGVLKWAGGGALTTTAVAAPSRPIEKLLVHYFGVVRAAPSMFGDVGLTAATGNLPGDERISTTLRMISAAADSARRVKYCATLKTT